MISATRCLGDRDRGSRWSDFLGKTAGCGRPKNVWKRLLEKPLPRMRLWFSETLPANIISWQHFTPI